MTEQEILALYEKADAVWFFNYDGDPKAPHAELTSGLCSDGYVNSAPVLADPRTVEFLASELVRRLAKRNVNNVDWVVGSAYSAITFSYEVARQLGAKHGFVEKDSENPKRMTWKRLAIPGGAEVLQCEELITPRTTTLTWWVTVKKKLVTEQLTKKSGEPRSLIHKSLLLNCCF